MAVDWNPNSPGIDGLEWLPSNAGVRVINGPSKTTAFKFRSTAAETLKWLHIYSPLVNTIKPRSGSWLIEIFASGNEIPGAVSTLTTRPSATNLGTSEWEASAGTHHSCVDEATLDVQDYVQYVGTYQQKQRIAFTYGSGLGSWPANRRIVGGRIVVVANRSEASGRLICGITGTSKGNYGFADITIDTEIREYQVPFPEINPSTGYPWTESDVDSGLALGDWIFWKPVGIGKHKPLRIYQTYLELDYVTENRVAVGLLDPTINTFDFVSGSLLHPNTGADNWSKANNTTYTIVIRRIPRWVNLDGATELDTKILESGAIGWGYTTEAELPIGINREPWIPDPYMESFAPTINSDGTIAVMGPAGNRVYGFELANASNVESVDSTGYYAIHSENGGIHSTTVGLGQEFTPDATDTYDLVRVVLTPFTLQDDLLGWDDVTNPDDLADINVKIKRRSDDVQMGSTTVVTAAEVFASPSSLWSPRPTTDRYERTVTAYIVDVEISGATLTSGVEYYVELTSANTSPTAAGESGWAWGTVVTSAPTSSFGGSTNVAVTTNGTTVSVTNSGYDRLFTIAARPDAPIGFTGSIDTQTLFVDTQGTTPDWLIDTLEFASFEWTPTSLADDFSYYEIQRSNDAGVTWESIARITDELVDDFEDYEGKRNAEAVYRMRVVSTWYTPSAWTSEVELTPTMTDCGLLFVSNEDPNINQGYVDIGGERRWNFLSSDERETHILVGRSYQVVTAPLENRGDRFEVELVLWAGSTPALVGRDHFDQIEALNRTALSYVCVLDESGRRWYADVSVTEGGRSGKVHTASATIIEVTDTSSLTDAVTD